jgi:hypothetical protein
MKPLGARFWSKVDTSGECWNWTGCLGSKGYGYIGLGRRRDGIESAHRAMWAFMNGPIPLDRWVLHKCDNMRCVRPSHLFLGGALGNVRDMDRKGRRVVKPNPGERNGFSLLTEQEVINIRCLYATGEWTQAALGRIFGTHPSNVSLIVRGKRWRHCA